MKAKNIRRRIGKITISDMVFMDNTKMLFKVFAKFIPVRLEHEYHIASFTYSGYSLDFEEVNEGDVIPTYNVVLEGKKVRFVLTT